MWMSVRCAMRSGAVDAAARRLLGLPSSSAPPQAATVARAWRREGFEEKSCIAMPHRFDLDRPFRAGKRRHYNQHMPSPPGTISQQIFWLVILAIPIATISRTVTAEEVFREPRD